MTKQEALIEARIRERNTGTRQYVLKTVTPTMPGEHFVDFIVTTDMPYFGEWYDADGIQHGGGA